MPAEYAPHKRTWMMWPTRAEVWPDIAATKREMNRLNAQFTGQPLEKIEHDADRDNWFTAEEAKEYGFVDHVVTTAGAQA